MRVPRRAAQHARPALDPDAGPGSATGGSPVTGAAEPQGAPDLACVRVVRAALTPSARRAPARPRPGTTLPGVRPHPSPPAAPTHAAGQRSGLVADRGRRRGGARGCARRRPSQAQPPPDRLSRSGSRQGRTRGRQGSVNDRPRAPDPGVDREGAHAACADALRVALLGEVPRMADLAYLLLTTLVVVTLALVARPFRDGGERR